MADTNQSIRTCILKVDIKCCSGCQKKACRKLQTIPGVTGAEYNAERGRMTIIGDVEPMTLVRKLTRLGKKTEIDSVNYHLDEEDSDDDSTSVTSSTSDPKIQEMTNTIKRKKTGFLRKLFLFGCCCGKSKVVQPFTMPNRNWHVPSKFENGGPGFRGPGFGGPGPFDNNSQWPPPYPMMPQYPPMMPNYPPMKQQQPQQLLQAPMAGAVMPNNANMLWSGPPQYQTQPYFISTLPPKPTTVNPSLHYPAK